MDFVRSAPVDIDVYLCGWDSAFSKVFSILEYLKVCSFFPSKTTNKQNKHKQKQKKTTNNEVTSMLGDLVLHEHKEDKLPLQRHS